MRNITFIGTLNSTFASRWREKRFPEQVQVGRDYAKKKAEGRRILNKDKTLIESAKENAAKARKSLKIDKREKPLVSPGYYQKRYAYDFEKEMKSYYLDKKKDRLSSNKIASSSIVAPKQSNTLPPAASPKNTTSLSNNSSPKLTPNTNNSSTTSLLQPKSKLGMKGKLGIGAIGLLSVGAVGYGLYRKTRSDKGKKRK